MKQNNVEFIRIDELWSGYFVAVFKYIYGFRPEGKSILKLNDESLMLRIKNLKAQGYDTSVEEYALVELVTARDGARAE